MSSKQIKGLTVEIGGDTSKLGQALKSVDDKSASLSSELKNINALLKLDPSNTELLAQKQKVLADAISNTEEKLKILKEAEQQAQAQFEKGEISAEQYRALQREVIAAETKLNQYKNALDETAQAAADLEKGTEQTTHELKKQEEQTEETKRETVKLDGSMGDAVKSGFAALIAAASAAIAALAALAESTREYRTEMAKLDTSFKDANFSSAVAYKTYKDLQGILGETNQAVEAANHLAALCTTEEDLAQWTNILTGVYAKFGTSLQVENLAEAANETARTGAVTGALADALNWAAAEGETFGVIMKEATEENEEWNKAVEEATNAEEYFNLALQACSSQQERQQLITKTLTKLYQSAATQYQETNKELIRANNANEDWNATLAECGEVVEPVITDVKELGTALLKQAKQPLKEVANYIRNTFLPALTKVGSWVKQNLPQISATIAGVTAALVAQKVATLAAELASKGWTVATLAQAAAQKALNAVMSATPWGLALTAVAGITAAMVTFIETSEDIQGEVSVFTEAEQELIDSANEAAQSFREQQKATKNTMDEISSQMGYVQALADELQTLADASGAVREEDQARVQFILSELNSALDTEYSMVDGVIQKYDELTASITQVIHQKTANLLMDAYNADYVAALQNEKVTWDALQVAQKSYFDHYAEANRLEQEYADFKALTEQRLRDGYYDFQGDLAEADRLRLEQLDTDLKTERTLRDDALVEFESATTTYGECTTTILKYETAQAAALQGNYEQAIGVLQEKGEAYSNYAETVDDETAKTLDTLKKEAIQAGYYAQLVKENFEKGTEGFSQSMVDEAERAYEDLLSQFETAYADALGVGADLGSGMADGMQTKREAVMQTAKNLVVSAINAMRTTADSHSPARKTIDFGEDMGEGAEIGIENKTKDVARAGERQAEALLDAYRSQEIRGQNTLRDIADQQAAAQFGSYMNAGAQNAGVLNKILAAIEKGQIITINGDLLVGATEGTMDSALGVRQVLAERSAL